jgi:hypothetical protein
VKVTVSVNEIGATVEDDEPFDEDRAGRILRIVGAGVLQVYETSLTLNVQPD